MPDAPHDVDDAEFPEPERSDAGAAPDAPEDHAPAPADPAQLDITALTDGAADDASGEPAADDAEPEAAPEPWKPFAIGDDAPDTDEPTDTDEDTDPDAAAEPADESIAFEVASSADAEPADPEPAEATNTPEPATAILIGTSAHVESLVDEILDPEREQLIVVVTAKPSAPGPFVDADALAARLGDQATVWVLDDPDLTWSMTDALPPKLDVYGGAVRAYTPIAAGDREPYPSDHPQWTVFNEDEGVRAADLIATYVELQTTRPLPAFGEVTTATVTTVRKAGAELELATGHPGFVSIGHLVQHGEVFHAADVLQEGQEVQVRVGSWNPHAARLSVSMREFAPDPWQRLADVYQPGMLVEGGVSGVTDFGAFIELLPGVEGLLHKSKVADEFVQYVDDYVREGDRITVRILDIDPDAQKAPVSLRDVPRDATPVPPASIFPGGPPWLPLPGDIAAAVDAEAEAATVDDPAPAETAAATADNAATADGDPAASTSPVASPADDADDRDEPSATDALAGGPDYAPQLQVLVNLIAEHGADPQTPLAGALRDALERGTMMFDARLDEDDEGSEDPADPLVQLRTAAANLIDALREAGDEEPADASGGRDA